MQDCNTSEKTAAPVTPLRTDSDGELWVNLNKNWEYAAAPAMLMYLANHTWPDIAFAVNSSVPDQSKLTRRPSSASCGTYKLRVQEAWCSRPQGRSL